MIGPRRVDNKPLVLYGAGKLGRLAGEIFNRLGILFMVIDKDTNSPYPVPGPDILVAVCVATSPYNEIK